MNNTKRAFIRLALDCGVLKFGEFILKSARKSPYFFNAGLFYTGESLQQLGQFYAQTLIDNKIACDHLFGPAYKGLPLATTAAVALAKLGVNATVTFNRKEIKEHGEGGSLIGAPLHGGKTVIVDDVITAGTAFREAQLLIQENGGQLAAVIIALDRCERGLSNHSTLTEIQAQGIQVVSIITLFDLIDYLRLENQNDKVAHLLAYQEQYGTEKPY